MDGWCAVVATGEMDGEMSAIESRFHRFRCTARRHMAEQAPEPSGTPGVTTLAFHVALSPGYPVSKPVSQLRCFLLQAILSSLRRLSLALTWFSVRCHCIGTSFFGSSSIWKQFCSAVDFPFICYVRRPCWRIVFSSQVEH
jgi:hypothetical protein